MRYIIAILSYSLALTGWAQTDSRDKLLDFSPSSIESSAAPTARGVVKASHEATLSAQMDGRILANRVKAGSSFRKGDILVEQDCTVREIALRKARVELTAKQTQHKLNSALKKRRAISDTEVEISRLEVEAAKTEIAGIQAEIGRCRITAPFDGRAIKLWAQTHETVKGGAEVLTVIADGALEFELFVPSLWLRWIRSGTRFVISVDELGRDIDAHIVSVGAAVDAASQTIDLRGQFLSPPEELADLLPGMSGTARFDRIASP